jgi:hypothetical protein
MGESKKERQGGIREVMEMTLGKRKRKGKIVVMLRSQLNKDFFKNNWPTKYSFMLHWQHSD